MKLIKRVVAIIQLAVIVMITTFSVSALPVAAAGNQSNQDINQPAMLIAPDPDFKINVYPKPGNAQRRIGFGLGGDAVTVIEQVGSNEGYTWNYVRFDRPPHLEGWIREDFVAPATDRLNQASLTQNGDRDDQNTRSRQGNQYHYGQNRYSQQQNNQRQNNPRQHY